jgi:hypothetical protein
MIKTKASGTLKGDYKQQAKKSENTTATISRFTMARVKPPDNRIFPLFGSEKSAKASRISREITVLYL